MKGRVAQSQSLLLVLFAMIPLEKKSGGSILRVFLVEKRVESEPSPMRGHADIRELTYLMQTCPTGELKAL